MKSYEVSFASLIATPPERQLSPPHGQLTSFAASWSGQPPLFAAKLLATDVDGVLTDAEREAVTMFAKYEGLLLDPVYTGRAAAGMLDLIRKGYFKRDETILFWHTGGQPALFAEKYANRL